MRPLNLAREDGRSRRESFVLDLETDGLGEVGRGEPEQFLAVLYSDREAPWVEWGPSTARYRARGKRRDLTPGERILQRLVDWGEPATVYAHWGGVFDFRLLYRWLFTVKRATGSLLAIGSGVLVADLRIDGVPIRLVDTIRLLPGKLVEIGKTLGYPKLDWDHATTREVVKTEKGCAELERYCVRDCEVLWKGIERVEGFARARGLSTCRSTIAATAAACIRSKLTHETVAWTPPQVELAELAPGRSCEDAMYAGRIERFGKSREYPAGYALELPAGYFYDFHSSYPAAMTEGPLPWRYVEGNPDGALEEDGPGGLIVAEVDVPETCALPVLPWRHPKTSRVYFPTGRWIGAFIAEELRYAESVGAARTFRVLSQHRWSGSELLGHFALDVWEQRAREKDPFLRYLWKLWGNALFGKTIEHREKMAVRANVESKEGWTELEDPEFGICGKEVVYDPSFRTVITGATITARARIRLHKALLDAGIEHVAYCHTDSVASMVKLEKLLCRCVTGGEGDCELGKLALEHVLVNGLFVAPGVYRFFDLREQRWYARAKGFVSRREGWIAPGMLDVLLEGGSTHYERHRGFRECVNAGDHHYYFRVGVDKRMRKERPKRHPNGRPWRVEVVKEDGEEITRLEEWKG